MSSAALKVTARTESLAVGAGDCAFGTGVTTIVGGTGSVVATRVVAAAVGAAATAVGAGAAFDAPQERSSRAATRVESADGVFIHHLLISAAVVHILALRAVKVVKGL
jgi:hypothetical protein